MSGPDLRGLSSDERFQVSVAFYRKYERAVAAWLMRRGWMILPVYDYCGLGESKAPKLTALNPAQSLVTPDLLVARNGSARWVEVKWKSRADKGILRSCKLTQSLGRNVTPEEALETGVSLRLWKQYEQVQATTGCDVWIVFVHELEQEVRGAPVSALSKTLRVYDGQKMGRHGMAFFGWDDLSRLAPIDSVLKELPATETQVVPVVGRSSVAAAGVLSAGRT